MNLHAKFLEWAIQEHLKDILAPIAKKAYEAVYAQSQNELEQENKDKDKRIAELEHELECQNVSVEEMKEAMEQYGISETEEGWCQTVERESPDKALMDALKELVELRDTKNIVNADTVDYNLQPYYDKRRSLAWQTASELIKKYKV